MTGEEANTRSASSASRQLLDQGLDHYGRNDIEAAVQCWRRAVELDPSNQDALDYLDAAGFEPVEARTGAQVIDISTARRLLTPLPPSLSREEKQAERTRQLEHLLEGKRYEEALDLLLRARLQSPEDPAISRGIRLLKDRLLLGYVRSLGDLAQVPVRRETEAPVVDPAASIYALVDGIASVEDILQISPFGRFESYRVLAVLLKNGVIALSEAAPWSLPVPEPLSPGDDAKAQTQDPPLRTQSSGPESATQPPERESMSNISESLQKLGSLDGFVGASLVDSDSGMVLGTEGGSNYNLELASALNTDVVRTKRKAMEQLGLGDQIDDILITLKEQYHIIRPIKNRPQVFIYLVCERAKSNLALARLRLAEVDGLLKV